jgi:hypothetical protein
MKDLIIKITKILLIINAGFWLEIAVYFSFFKYAGKTGLIFVNIMLFLQPVLYIFSFIGINKKIKYIYIFSIFFVISNALLSISGGFGIYDKISLILNIITLIFLMLIKKYIFIKK